jgi:hypothetical protein
MILERMVPSPVHPSFFQGSHMTNTAGLEKNHRSQRLNAGDADTRMPKQGKLERGPTLNLQAEYGQLICKPGR